VRYVDVYEVCEGAIRRLDVYNDLAVEGWSRRERREQRGDCRPRRRSLRAARRAGTRRPRGAAWYESAWAAEGQGKSAFGKLERWAVHTERIGLATGIVNVFSRTPAAIAQAVATLDAHSGGRAVLGLGVAHPGVVEGSTARSSSAPSRGWPSISNWSAGTSGATRRVRRGVLLAVADRVLGGVRARARVDPDLQRRAGARQRPPDRTVRGRVGAEPLPGLAVQGGEGVARRRRGPGGDRDPASIDVAMYVLTAVDEDPERARRAAAEHIAYYLRDIPGYYDRAAVEAGSKTSSTRSGTPPRRTPARSESRPGSSITSRSSGLPRRRGPNWTTSEIGVDLPIVRAPPGATGVGGAHAGSVRAVAMSRRVVAVSRLLCAVAMRRSPRVGTLRVPNPSPSPTELCDSSSYWHSLT